MMHHLNKYLHLRNQTMYLYKVNECENQSKTHFTSFSQYFCLNHTYVDVTVRHILYAGHITHFQLTLYKKCLKNRYTKPHCMMGHDRLGWIRQINKEGR